MMDDNLLVDISDALSERDRVRFTVHTRTKLPQFSKSVLSVVRQHEEFIWLHDCLVENDQYAGYIIPPAPPKPDFDASREKLQRLGDCEANLTKEEFAKMKQELEAEYLAIFKKTVAMHEIFLQRLASHEKFRNDSNFKIFLEYENELAVRGKSKREKLAGSISNIGKSLTDFVITTSQVAHSNSIGNLASNNFTGSLSNSSNMNSEHHSRYSNNNNNIRSSSNNNIIHDISSTTPSGLDIISSSASSRPPSSSASHSSSNDRTSSHNNSHSNLEDNGTNGSSNNVTVDTTTISTTGNHDNTNIDEQYFEKERLFLALYYNSIRESAICSDKVTQAHRCVADSYLHLSHQLVRLASIEVVPITAQTKNPSGFVGGHLPSLTLPTTSSISSSTGGDRNQLLDQAGSSYENSSMNNNNNNSVVTNSKRLEIMNDDTRDQSLEEVGLETASNASIEVPLAKTTNSFSHANTDNTLGDNKSLIGNTDLTDADDVAGFSNSQGDINRPTSKSTGGCASDHTSEGLKRLLLHVSDYLEQAKKIEARIASDEDLKLTDTLLYYKRDTIAAQDLLMRRLRFMSEYENATKNLDKARVKGRTAMQYADVIQKQAKENFLSISKQAKQELTDYKKRRVTSFRKAFTDLAELEIKHLRSHSQLLANCLNICRGLTPPPPPPPSAAAASPPPPPKPQPERIQE